MGLREEQKNKVEAQIKEWDAKIEELKAKAAQVTSDNKIEYFRQIEKLENKRDAVKKDLEEMVSSGEDKVELFKEKLDAAVEEAKGILEGIASMFGR
ncbi:MAG: coiled coil domain-containing protein [Candidatus Omnitrophica bacterium]|nr:coiled coil domain-containing protein [Candidatus Omnitrophota bacterium]